MKSLYLTLVITLLYVRKLSCEEPETYTAAVVEISLQLDYSVSAETNILNNVKKYVEVIETASSSTHPPNIIVFPESSLNGYLNQKVYSLKVPDPADKIQLCNVNTNYAEPLVRLACAAQSTSTYVVVNLCEDFYNSTLQANIYFNTLVVFDPTGIVVARYRKIHLFNEGLRQPSPNKDLVYFDTTFGVRFGLLTCFDIIFKDPGVVLAKEHGVNHFIIAENWFSEMPFLTAIQEQYYWSYTLDVVLLAAGLNYPSAGSSGSGIYLGRKGPVIYNMTNIRGSFKLQANIPKDFQPKEGITSVKNIQSQYTAISFLTTKEKLEPSQTIDQTKIKMKQDYLSVYTTELIQVPNNIKPTSEESFVKIPFSVERTLCHNSLCCNFSISITAVFSRNTVNVTRGDDYSQFYYRLAVFDGVKSYDGADTGGVQTCAVIPCTTTDILSCGQRSDNTFSFPNVVSGFHQIQFIFESLAVKGNFSNNDSFVGPNILLKGQGDNFGELITPKDFLFSEIPDTKHTIVITLQTLRPTELVTASLYGRLFSRDGEQHTDTSLIYKESSALELCTDVILFVFAVAIIKYSISNNY